MGKNPKKLYKKLFVTYFIIIFCIVIALEMFFITKLKEQYKENSLTYLQVMFDKAATYIQKSSKNADYIINNLYLSTEELNDVINYLEKDLQAYIERRLDAFSNSSSTSYGSIESFTQKTMEFNENVEYISYFSYQNKGMSRYLQGGNITIKDMDAFLSTNPDFNELTEPGYFSFVKEIRNPNNLQNIGCMVVTFNDILLKEAYDFYPTGKLVVFDQLGKVIYDGGGSFNKEEWFDYEGIIRSVGMIEKETDSYIIYQNYGQYNLAAYMNTSEMSRLPFYLWLTLLGIGVLILIIGITMVSLHLRKLTERLKKILDSMEKVTKGNLNIRLDTGKENDEIDVISRNFNDMCLELSNYIEKSYLLEIEQKNAEMNALQSQVNPHFLYNTLESIRMRAICNGDKEVGKMLYGMAVIFRSQIKESNIITIAKELHYCKKYMELYQFRHQKKFEFTIVCNEKWMQIPIIKFIIQPIIENYFIHGIRLDEQDNELRITVHDKGKDLMIRISDNGKGMRKEEIEEQNKILTQNEKGVKGSIGLKNVNSRLRAAYGKEYGIILKQNEIRGISILLKFPIEEEDTHV